MGTFSNLGHWAAEGKKLSAKASPILRVTNRD
jgi:hypothetical protein